jgi:hypothetical protein
LPCGGGKSNCMMFPAVTFSCTLSIFFDSCTLNAANNRQILRGSGQQTGKNNREKIA